MAIFLSIPEMRKRLAPALRSLRASDRVLAEAERLARAMAAEGQTASTIKTAIDAILTGWGDLRTDQVATITGITAAYKPFVKPGMPAAYWNAVVDASDPINDNYGTIRVAAVQETTVSPFAGAFLAGDRVIISEAGSDLNNDAFTLRYTPQPLGVNLIENGGFDSTADWTETSVDITIAGGVAGFFDATSSELNQAVTDMVSPGWVEGIPYLVTYTVTRTAGSLLVGTSTQQNFRSVDASGTYSAIVVADDATNGLIFTGNGFTGTLDNVSMRAWTGLAFTGGLNADTAADTTITVTLEER